MDQMDALVHDARITSRAWAVLGRHREAVYHELEGSVLAQAAQRAARRGDEVTAGAVQIDQVALNTEYDVHALRFALDLLDQARSSARSKHYEMVDLLTEHIAAQGPPRTEAELAAAVSEALADQYDALGVGGSNSVVRLLVAKRLRKQADGHVVAAR